jgi:hypothetical protein
VGFGITSLKAYYHSEKKKQEFLANSARIVNTAQNINTVLHTLDIRDPGLSKTIEYAAVAQNVMSQALTGNYIGAALAVTGLLGGSKPSPEQQQFSAIMGYLQRLDQKLNQIYELQVKTLEAIEGLSKQIAELDRNLHLRLDRVDFELKTISENLKGLIWKPYTSCNTAWQDRSAQFDDDNLTFKSVGDLVKFVKGSGGTAIVCARELDGLFLSPKSMVFRGLLSLSTAATTDFTILPEEQGRHFGKSDLERFRDEIHRPAVLLTRSKWKSEWGAPANLIALFSSPSPSYLESKARLAELERNKNGLNACSKPTILSHRLRSLLCVDQRYAPVDAPAAYRVDFEERARDRTNAFMADAIIRDQLPDLVKWTALTARAYDFWTGANEVPYSFGDLASGKGAPHGKDLIWGMLGILDIAIAQQTMIHGDLTAHFAYGLVWDRVGGLSSEGQDDVAKAAVKLVRNPQNPWLARNVLMIALDELVKIKGSGDASIPYAKALNEFFTIQDPKLNSEEDRARASRGKLFLRTLFELPTGATFDVQDEKVSEEGPVRKLFIVTNGARIEMPTVQAFKERAFTYPPSLYGLIHLRDLLAERYVDYGMIDLNNPDASQRISEVLFLGLAGQ